jgi:lipopolysaccharide export system protein LptA
MRPHLALLAAAIALFAIAPAPAHAQISRQGGPIDITADSTEFVSSQNVNRWIGRVHVRQGDAELKADRMDVYFTGGENGAAREIERIEAEGSVIYNNPIETARGDRGVYLASEERIRLTGRVRLIRGPDVFCGEELVIQPRLGQFEAVGGTSSNDPLCSGRVRGVISSAEGERPREGAGGAQPNEAAGTGDRL